jgi:transposase
VARRITPEVKARILADLQADQKLRVIEERHGVARRTVYLIAREAGLPLRNQMATPKRTTADERSARDDEIERLYRAGVPYKEIVETLGVSWGMIPRVVKARNLPERKSTRNRVYLTRQAYADRRAVMQEMRTAGATLAEIANRLGISTGTVSSALNGLPRGGEAPRAPHVRTGSRIVALYESGESIKSIVRTCGVSHPVIYQALHDAGVPLRKRPWTEAEDMVLTTDLPDDVIAEVLVRSVDAVRMRRSYLGKRAD